MISNNSSQSKSFKSLFSSKLGASKVQVFLVILAEIDYGIVWVEVLTGCLWILLCCFFCFWFLLCLGSKSPDTAASSSVCILEVLDYMRLEDFPLFFVELFLLVSCLLAKPPLFVRAKVLSQLIDFFFETVNMVCLIFDQVFKITYLFFLLLDLLNSFC